MIPSVVVVWAIYAISPPTSSVESWLSIAICIRICIGIRDCTPNLYPQTELSPTPPWAIFLLFVLALPGASPSLLAHRWLFSVFSVVCAGASVIELLLWSLIPGLVLASPFLKQPIPTWLEVLTRSRSEHSAPPLQAKDAIANPNSFIAIGDKWDAGGMGLIALAHTGGPLLRDVEASPACSSRHRRHRRCCGLSVLCVHVKQIRCEEILSWAKHWRCLRCGGASL